MRALVALALCAVGGPALGKPGRTDENMSGRRELRMTNCPSAVVGAITEVTDLPNGVAVTVRAPDDPLAAAEIRRRVRLQLEIVDQPERGAIEHTGVGTGSGRYGFCPGMLEHTAFDVLWTSDGAHMYVRADDPDDIKRLQVMTHKRAAALAARRRNHE
jgi:hypothetical protein